MISEEDLKVWNEENGKMWEEGPFSLGLIQNLTKNLNRELRWESYPVIHFLLSNPIVRQFDTGIYLDPNDVVDEGGIFIFDKKNQYREYGIEWENNNKMSLKIILKDELKGRYKLKSHKNDVGIPVMRRQTWKAQNWRKTEYKLVNTHSQHHSILEFPVLIHYYRQNNNPIPLNPISENEIEPISTKKARFEENLPEENDQNSALFLPSPFSLDVMLLNSFENNNVLENQTNPEGGQSIASPSLLSIINYSAPEFGIAGRRAVGTIVLDNCHVIEGQNFKIIQKSGGEINYKMLDSNNIFEIRMFSLHSGKLLFYAVLEDTLGNIIAQTHILSFFFMPPNPNLSTYQTEDGNFDTKSYCDSTEELDFSHKELDNVDFLRNFSRLHTLNLHDNLIDSNYLFPVLLSLRKLEVDHNRIDNLDTFLEGLSRSFPNLLNLNLIGNPAISGFVQPHQYFDYRFQVIAKLKRITTLDNVKVSVEELRKIVER